MAFKCTTQCFISYCFKQNNINRQNKIKLDKLKNKRENKWNTIKNILLQNQDKTDKELIDVLFLVLNKQVTKQTLYNYKQKLKSECNKKSFKDVA